MNTNADEAAQGAAQQVLIVWDLVNFCMGQGILVRAPEFFAGLLNNQPMGFYSPATLVKNAKRYGVRIRPVNVWESDCLCTVGADGILRLGLCYGRGLAQEDGERIVAERQREGCASLADFQLRSALPKAGLRTLAKSAH